ncbi:uncharacterized protein LOC109599528 isoform X2 [Aethina tumida]|uniref:uncharacterized protein LOC109599528 isoform X2 n=1 Tax=Aethina tumida TaxID=116153 RepID=UPI002147C993|nr:uncharacterized protein LOC109599528 isoform X2 [Aethina tumida]
MERANKFKEIPADLAKSWHIPRPTLAHGSKSSKGSTSSNNSTQSARSGSLLLTAANLAQIHQADEAMEARDAATTRNQNIQYYLQSAGGGDALGLPVGGLGAAKKPVEPDNVSIASSMHFTVVNMNTRQTAPKRSFCRKHHITILVLSMSALFTIGILTAIFLLEMRAKRQRY